MHSPSSQTPLMPSQHLSTPTNRFPGSLSRGTLPLFSSVAIAAFTSILYGYHMSELNAPSQLIQKSLNLSDGQLGLATSSFSLGGLIASSLASNISSKYGLRYSFLLTLGINCMGSFIEARSFDVITLVLGRTISGLSGGLAIVLVPLYVNSVSPSSLRGLLGSMTQVSVNLGILLTQLAALWLATDSNWRQILDIAWIIGAIGFLLTYFYLYESPRWFVLNAQKESLGLETLSIFRNGDVNLAQLEINDWKRESERRPNVNTNIGFYQYLTDPQYTNSKVIATISMVGQQFSGINSVIFYGVTILNGLFPQWSIGINCIISIGNMLVTAIASLYLDILGRKPMLLLSLIFMGFSCIGLSYGIYSQEGTVTIISIFTYVASFAIGCGPIPFLLISEVSQIEVKPIAQGWATNCNWVSVFIIGLLFPIVNEYIGAAVYLFFALISFLFAVFVLDFVPETMNKSTYASVWRLDERIE